MGFNIISAAEAASYIKHGYNIGLSGFTPAGTPKAVTPEVALFFNCWALLKPVF